MEWIKTSDKWPEENGSYWVFYMNTLVTMYLFHKDSFYINSLWKDNVTHYIKKTDNDLQPEPPTE